MDPNKKGRPNPKAGTTVTTDKHTGHGRIVPAPYALRVLRTHAAHAQRIAANMLRVASGTQLNALALDRIRMLQAVADDVAEALEERKAGEHR
ncbi:hypothetical protein [Pauljensenia sp. UMB1177]|uniref:hypothetical protein n=1 Tax=Pauljensenia sp. UMB1177 TaxID=3046323 RepID=UPI000CD81E54|nr:hypothetical protein [Pauljensenia sp. UMB1177]MDK7229776.1 hypothetical protein [Pauljensenia sp. UMB1177]